MRRIVAPFGFYGAGNIGDEATLNGFARLVARSGPGVHVSVGSRNTGQTARAEPSFSYFHAWRRDPRRWVATLRADGAAIIGGTPIMDVEGDWPLSELTPLVRSIDRRGLPLAFIGCGTEPLRAERSRRIVTEEIAPRTRCWSVRCDRDRARLVECGVPPSAVTVAADMAWLIEPATAEFGRACLERWGVVGQGPLVGVNLVNENALLDREPHLVDVLARTFDRLADEAGATIVFLANEVRDDAQFDVATSRRIIDRMGARRSTILAPNLYFTPREMMSIIACCSITVTMRYHFCIFSALQGVPFVALERSGKIADLCWDLGWQARLPPLQLPDADVAGMGTALMAGSRELRERLGSSVQRMRDRAALNGRALDALTGVAGLAAAGGAPAYR